MTKEVWEEHDILFHYTTSQGLTGIIESRALHATHYKYMNDTSEILHLAPKLKDIALPGVKKAISGWATSNRKLAEFIGKQGGMDKVVDSEVGNMIDSMYRVTFGVNGKSKFLQPYFASFCHHGRGTYERENGLLSQWRAYGRDAGFAMVFDVKRLADLFHKEGGLYFFGYGGFGDVVYGNDAASFNDEFRDLVDLVGEQFPKLALLQKPDLSKIFAPFAQCVSRYKHQAFSEEREVRLCWSPLAKELVSPQTPNYATKKEKPVRFKNGLTPYIAAFEEIGEPLPIISRP